LNEYGINITNRTNTAFIQDLKTEFTNSRNLNMYLLLLLL